MTDGGMTDMFASYAEAAVPRAVQRRQERAERPPSALDKKLAEKQRLTRSYRILKRREAQETLAQEPRLAAFTRFVRQCADADELVDAIRESWLPTAPENVRTMALRIVAARCDKLNKMAGFPALDDPLPPETSCYFRVKEALGAR